MTETGQLGVVNWHGSLPGLILTGKFRRRLKSSVGPRMSVECRNMTAIVSTYVEGQGFAIGADGLRTDQKTGETVTENARKIFFIEGDGVRLAYAWAGAGSLLLGDGQEFSFPAQSASAGNELATSKPGSMDEYVYQFAANMYKRLRAVCLPDGRLSADPSVFPREEIARVLFVGYYDGRPWQAEVTFSQNNSVLQLPFMHELIESPPNLKIFSGSAVVLQQFEPLVAPENLEEAVELVRKYIQACVANTTDPYCASIGGHVHVARVTREATEWVVPPVA